MKINNASCHEQFSQLLANVEELEQYVAQGGEGATR